ncbi:hypothetical protein D3C73_979400 [compost metagenome]
MVDTRVDCARTTATRACASPGFWICMPPTAPLPQRCSAWRTIAPISANGTALPAAGCGGRNSRISLTTSACCRLSSSVDSPHGMYSTASITSPLQVIMKWNGRPSTEAAAWPSSHERWPLPQRKVKKSAKIFLWVMTPLTMATSMNIAHTPTIQRPHIAGM